MPPATSIQTKSDVTSAIMDGLTFTYYDDASLRTDWPGVIAPAVAPNQSEQYGVGVLRMSSSLKRARCPPSTNSCP